MGFCLFGFSRVRCCSYLRLGTRSGFGEILVGFWVGGFWVGGLFFYYLLFSFLEGVGWVLGVFFLGVDIFLIFVFM